MPPVRLHAGSSFFLLFSLESETETTQFPLLISTRQRSSYLPLWSASVNSLENPALLPSCPTHRSSSSAARYFAGRYFRLQASEYVNHACCWTPYYGGIVPLLPPMPASAAEGDGDTLVSHRPGRRFVVGVFLEVVTVDRTWTLFYDLTLSAHHLDDI